MTTTEALNYALNQWEVYSDASRGPDAEFPYIAESRDGDDGEAQMFQQCRDALTAADPVLAAVRDWVQYGAGDGTYAAEAEAERLATRIAAAFDEANR